MLKLCDVTLRDGIQNLPKFISTSKKLNIYKHIYNSGIDNIEIGSNVSNKITQMSDLQSVLKGIKLFHYDQTATKPNLTCLVPSFKKYNEFLSFTGQEYIDTIALITAATNSFTYRNMGGMTIKKSLEEIDTILDYNKKISIPKRVRIYISCCFGCPFIDPSEDPNEVKKVIINNTIDIINRYSSNPFVYEIIISDTIGKYDELMLNNVLMNIDNKSFSKIGIHLHISNTDVSKVLISTLSKNIKLLDVSHSYIGGCPSIDDNKKIKSNLNIIDLLDITRKLGFKDNIDIDKVIYNNKFINNLLH